MDSETSFVRAFVSALQDNTVRESLSDIVGESFRAEIAFLKAELSKKDGEIDALKRRVDTLESQNDSLEQYTRRNSLRVTGLQEDPNENILDRTLHMFNSTMQVEPPITTNDIDRVHRVGKRSSSKTRSIIIKFTSYRARQVALKKRKAFQIAVPNAYINEDLTVKRSTMMYKARMMKRQGYIKDCWTHDGTMIIKDNNDETHSARNLIDGDNLMAKFVNHPRDTSSPN